MPDSSPRIDETNPFRPPETPIDPEPIRDAEIIRRSYLAHESKVRSLGLMGYLAAGLAVALAIAYADELGERRLTSHLLPAGLSWLDALLLIGWLVVLAGVVLVLSFGLRRLAPWARWSTVAAAGLAFLAYLARYALALSLGTRFFNRPGLIVGNTLGLLASGYVLLVLLSRRSSRVFGREYRAITRQTPKIQPNVSVAARAVIGTVAALILAYLLSLGISWFRR